MLPSIVILTIVSKKSLSIILKHVGYVQKCNFALTSLAYNVWVVVDSWRVSCGKNPGPWMHMGYVQKWNFALNSLACKVWVASCNMSS